MAQPIIFRSGCGILMTWQARL